MRMTHKIAIAAAAWLALAPAAHAGFDDNKPISITATGISTHSIFKAIMEVMHGLYRQNYPGTDATLKPSTVAGGLLAVANKKADIVMAVPPVELKNAINGDPPFPKSLKGKVMHVFTIMNNLDFFFIAQKSWADRYGIKSIADIGKKKPKMTLGLSRRGTYYSNTAAERVFEANGFKIADVKKWGGDIVYSNTRNGIKDMTDGKIDFMFQGTIQPDPRIKRLARSRGIVWISAKAATLKKVAKELGFHYETLPKSAYPFMTKAEPSMRVDIYTMAGAQVPAETVYKMVKAVAENLDKIRAVHPAFRHFSLKQMVQKSPLVPYHPGAARYYREKGLIK